MPDYENISNPYNTQLVRSPSDLFLQIGGGNLDNSVTQQGQDTNVAQAGGNTAASSDAGGGPVQQASVGSGGAMADIVIKNSIQSLNWAPKKTGFYINGQTGYAEFSDIFTSGAIAATSGTIGGFDIGADYIRDVANSMGLASTVTGGDDIRFWAGDTFANRATAPFRVSEAGVVVAKSISIGGSTIQYTINDSGIFSYGDGSDGAFTTSGNVTLTSDKYYTDLTIATGHVFSPAGYRIFCTGTLTEAGTGKIARDGNAGGAGSNGTNNGSGAGTGGTAGAALADGYLKGSVAGKVGAATTNNPSTNGVAGTAGATTTNSIGADGATGGTGGNANAGGNTGGAGGAGGVATQSNVKLIANWHLATLLDVSSTGSTVKFDNSAGSGSGGSGAGGANSAPSNGGGGGSGGGSGSSGGIVAIYARNIVIGASASITATGGAGGAGGNGANGQGDNASGGGGGAGGAGGNGGQLILVYNTLTNNGSITAAGGAAGAGGTKGLKAGTGQDGTDGNAGAAGTAGTVRLFPLSL